MAAYLSKAKKESQQGEALCSGITKCKGGVTTLPFSVGKEVPWQVHKWRTSLVPGWGLFPKEHLS